ncbi:hypothetical protein [Rheinheimera sp.]|jgi:hypothetical protein|uniref:hypothetical protein n=1 Tax=Rheinheimera sp. TaxID=1869214 RepID=UPI0026119C03|nr:hypothetical protein [Rheinheimera sp.]MCA1929055.1 hypothetical protein [Rheinheimera sp.]
MPYALIRNILISSAVMMSPFTGSSTAFALDLPADAERYASVPAFLQHGNSKTNHYSGIYLKLSPKAAGHYEYLQEGKKKLRLKDKAFMVSASGLFYQVEQQRNGEYWIRISPVYQDKLDGKATVKALKLV